MVFLCPITLTYFQRVSDCTIPPAILLFQSVWIRSADITAILIQQKTKYSDSGEEAMKAVCEMLDRGVSLWAAAAALGVSHSTLEYQVKKYRGDE